MSGITRGTTPRVNVALLDRDDRNIDLSNYDVIVLSISDGKHEVDVTKEDMTFNTDYSIDCLLTQSETLALLGKTVEVQIRAKDSEGIAIASDI